MINAELYQDVNLSSLCHSMENAYETMSKTSNKLVLVLRDKTDSRISKALDSFSQNRQIQLINLGLLLSTYMLEHEEDEVMSFLPKLLKAQNALIIDNAEILFDQELNVKPFQLLKDAARHQVLFVVLDAKITADGKFVYGNSSSKDFNQYEKLTDTYVLNLIGGTE